MNVDSIPKSVKEEIMILQERLKNQLENENKPSSQLKAMKNLMILCLAIFLLYLPFQPLTNLQSTMNFDNNVGMISQAIIYISNILSCLFLPKLTIKKLGCKYTFVLCILAFIPFFGANFYPHIGIFSLTAGILGLGSGLIWSTIGYYIKEISELYADGITNTVEVVISRFFGIFYMTFQNTQIWGNLMTFYVIKPYDSTVFNYSFSAPNSTADIFEEHLYKTGNLSCGADFCGGMNKNLEPPSMHTRYILISMYLIFPLISALAVFLFMDPLKPKGIEDESIFSKAIATGKHLRHAHQLLLVPLTIFCGIEEAFIVADFSQAYVACASGLYNISLVYICFGVVNAIMSFLSGRLVQYLPRVSLISAAALVNFGVGIALLLWQPTEDAFVYFLTFVGIMGLCDALWRTQLHAVYGVVFKEEQEAAFANFRLWESVGFGLGFGYSGFLCMYKKIYILLSFIIIGTVGYIIVEIRHYILNSTYNISDSPEKE